METCDIIFKLLYFIHMSELRQRVNIRWREVTASLQKHMITDSLMIFLPSPHLMIEVPSLGSRLPTPLPIILRIDAGIHHQGLSSHATMLLHSVVHYLESHN